MLKVDLIGVGGISGAHIPAWERMEDAELVALCDIRPEQLERYPEKHLYTDLDRMLEQEKLDILDICLPTYLHAGVGEKAMKKGIHVICEKPVSLNQEDVARLYQTAKENHVCFMVAQVLRFWLEYEYVKQVYESGKYGKLLSGYMQRLSKCPGWSWDGWMKAEERSGLVPFDLHIHDLDFLVYAFGVPKKVSAFRARNAAQDAVTAVYSFDGFYVNTEASWYAADYPFHAGFRFQFEKAVVEWKGSLKVYGADGVETGDVRLPQSDAYANELRYFTDCVKEGWEPDKVKPGELEAVIDILRSL